MIDDEGYLCLGDEEHEIEDDYSIEDVYPARPYLIDLLELSIRNWTFKEDEIIDHRYVIVKDPVDLYVKISNFYGPTYQKQITSAYNKINDYLSISDEMNRNNKERILEDHLGFYREELNS